MIEIKLHTVIDSEDVNKEARLWGIVNDGEDAVFSLDVLQRALNEHPDDDEIRIDIHCDGGSVSEGLAIYDTLRQSGKTIHTNIEGGCHSMAVCILLAAPKENRSANRNCSALIHKVKVPVWDLFQDADQLRSLADDVEREQNKILDIYADRTDLDRDTLEAIMKEEKQHTAQELLDWGFIGKINPYTTNVKPHNHTDMAKNNSKESLLKRFANFLNSIDESVNYDHTDADGNVLFSTEKDDDSLAVGDAATPDGEFTLADGRTVTIEGGVITKIEEAANPDEELDNLRKENESLKNKVDELEAQVTEATNLLKEARNEIQSTYVPEKRNLTPKAAPIVKSAEDIKNELAEKRKQMKG